MPTPRQDRNFLITTAPIIMICLVFVMSNQEAWAQTYIEKAGLALKGEYLFLEDKPDGVGDYMKNTLFFPFGIFLSALVVGIAPLNAVLLPGDCFRDPALKGIMMIQTFEHCNRLSAICLHRLTE